MDYPTLATTPPGWYADPRDPRLQRWFDGSGWSDHVRPGPVWGAPVAPDVVPASRPGTSGRARKAAAVPVGLLLVSLVLKLGFLAARVIEDRHEDSHEHAPQAAPAVPAVPAVPQEFPFRGAELQEEIVGTLATQGVTATVTCPADTATVMPGMEFLCTVDDGGGGAGGTAHVVVTAGGGWTWTYTAGCWDLGC